MGYDTRSNLNKNVAFQFNETHVVFYTIQINSRFEATRVIYIYCSRILLVYLFIRFARISYGRFIAMRYNFKLSTYIQEPLVIGGVEYRERFKRENG
jgi:hypothetical protein